MLRSLPSVLAWGLLAGCAATNESPEPAAGGFGALRPADPDRRADDGAAPGGADDGGADDGGADGADGGADGGSGGSDGDGSGGDGSDGGAAQTGPIRFVALGDAGTGGEAQYTVADAATAVCAELGCDFALYLGDNIYNDGVTSIDDAQWREKFEDPYSPLDLKFYAVLGNHDYGDGGGGFDIDRAEAQVEYTYHSDKWVMPDTFYSHVQGDVAFFGLDTTALDWANTEAQAAWLPGALASANTTWKIAYGHHPYVSNGDHGNANDNFGPFFEDHLCGRVDLYLSGHDHDLQWLEPTCGTEFVVSGAAAKLRDTGLGDNPTFFEESTYGFLWAEIDGDTFTGVMFDSEGRERFRRSFTR